MKIINKSIRCAQVLKGNWKDTLDSAIKRYRAATHPFTGYSPNELMNLEDEIELPSIFESETVIEEAVDTDDKNMKLKSNARFNKAKNANHIDFSEGDKVLHKWIEDTKM